MLYLTDKEFGMIMNYIKNNYGVNLAKKRTLIEGRLSNYIAGLGYTNYEDYFHYALSDKSGVEMSTLINKLTTNHTYFLREREHFDFYKDMVLPWVDKTIGTRDLRVWSAGCSSGQEPYTLSMITLDYLGTNAGCWDSTILASDISSKALGVAINGAYAEEELSNLSNSYIRKYFRPLSNGKYSITETLKKNVVFREFNLLSPFNFKKPFHAIMCRNVMIYFDIPEKNVIINKFYDALLPGGFLFVGLSESLSGSSHGFKAVRPSIYRKPG